MNLEVKKLMVYISPQNQTRKWDETQVVCMQHNYGFMYPIHKKVFISINYCHFRYLR